MKVIVGYGKFENHRLEEVSDQFLSELGDRYSLQLAANLNSDRTDLLITIAVHEEIKRRDRGGKAYAKHPSARQLADRIITKGFQMLSSHSLIPQDPALHPWR